MELPVHSGKEGHLVRVDLKDSQSRHLTPCFRGEIPVLQVLGSQNESCEKHATSTLKSAVSGRILGLLHGEVVLWDVRLDQYQVVQGYLEG
jgi:hypothetical protein